MPTRQPESMACLARNVAHPMVSSAISGKIESQNGSPAARSRIRRTSAVRVGSNSFVWRPPEWPVSFQWIRFNGSPGSYGRTPANRSRSSNSRGAREGRPKGRPRLIDMGMSIRGSGITRRTVSAGSSRWSGARSNGSVIPI